MHNYGFPAIYHIDDMRPHLEGVEGFVIRENPESGVIVCNYTHNAPGMFDIDPANPLPGMIRREARGSFFDIETGIIVSRPFHKFFNLGENEESMARNIDFTKRFAVMEKLDGSMMRPIYLNDRIYLATKAGITDTSIQCMEEIELTDDQIDWLGGCCLSGLTPLLEYTSPKNRIVVGYDKPQLRLLHIRENVSGTYMQISKDYLDRYPFEFTPYWDTNNVTELLSQLKSDKSRNREGVVVWFEAGAFKCKSDVYVDLHNKKDAVRYPHKVAQMYLDDLIDDVMPDLDDIERKNVEDWINDFTHAYNVFASNLREAYDMYVEDEDTKKDVALRMQAQKVDSVTMSYVFKMLDGGGHFDFVDAKVQGFIKTQTSYTEFMKMYG